MTLRRLYVVLGDQLHIDSVLDADFDPERDALWMAERRSEAKRAWSHKMRLAYFISAMRHFRQQIHERGWSLIYRSAGDHADDTLPKRLVRDLDTLQPEVVIVTRPGDLQLHQELGEALDAADPPWQLREDPHVLTTPQDFADWAQGRKQLRMEYFYRQQRQRYRILLDGDGEPRGASRLGSAPIRRQARPWRRRRRRLRWRRWSGLERRWRCYQRLGHRAGCRRAHKRRAGCRVRRRRAGGPSPRPPRERG